MSAFNTTLIELESRIQTLEIHQKTLIECQTLDLKPNERKHFYFGFAFGCYYTDPIYHMIINTGRYDRLPLELAAHITTLRHRASQLSIDSSLSFTLNESEL